MFNLNQNFSYSCFQERWKMNTQVKQIITEKQIDKSRNYDILQDNWTDAFNELIN